MRQRTRAPREIAKFEREQVIVESLNRGASVGEIAARIGVSEKRMHAIIREILARRMPAPPEEFVAIQVSRLNEALLVAYSAMSITNLKAVDRVVKIVRELDRYHGFVAAERRRPEPPRIEAPAQATVAFGAALFCSAELALQEPGEIMFERIAQLPLAPLGRGEGRGEGLGRLAADARPAPHPNLLPVNGEKGRFGASTGDDRPEIPPQAPENIEFGLGIAQDPLAPPRRGEPRGEGRGRLAAVAARPAPHPNLLPVDGEKGRFGASAGDDRP